jgi:hypothetical protein
VRLGATFEKLADWKPLSVVHGRLITGQNSASSTVAAQNLINLLTAEKAASVSASIDAGIGSPSDQCVSGRGTARATRAELNPEGGCARCA